MKYRNRLRWRAFISSPVTIIGLVIIAAVLGKAAYNIHQKDLIAATRLLAAQTELSKLQARQADLEAQISRLSSDQGVEAELRTKYRAVREGEQVAVIVGEDQAAQVADASTTPAEVSWWQRILHFFGI